MTACQNMLVVSNWTDSWQFSAYMSVTSQGCFPEDRLDDWNEILRASAIALFMEL
ncbi:hypothetical protein OAG34_01620 [bacterium]|nr:hypothetical protein [bacterium]